MHTTYENRTRAAAKLRGRPPCPIHLALQTLGDRWSLLIIRDMVFDDRRTFGELLAGNPEGIASNILASRLKRLESFGLIGRFAHPVDKRKNILRLSPAAIELVPVLVELGAWGTMHLHADPARSARVMTLLYEGPRFIKAFMHDLAATHSRSRPPFASYRRLAPQTGGPIAQALTAAHAAAMASLAGTAGRPRTGSCAVPRRTSTSGHARAGTSRHRPAGTGSRGSSATGPAGCHPGNPTGPPTP